MNFTDADRPIRLTTPLGEDKLILVSLSGTETISGLFQFELSAVGGGSAPVKFKDILGKSVTASIEVYGITRKINGIVKSVSQGAYVSEQDVTWYYLTVVPSMWLLTRRTDCRIFQNKSIPDIVLSVLKGAGISDVENNLFGTYDPRDYTVQYRETDFAFVSRLMEFAGIYYFFKHEDGKHTMVIGDDRSTFSDLPNGADVTFENIEGGLRSQGWIHSWNKGQEINSGKYSLNDHNFETPDASLLADTDTGVSLDGNSGLELYENAGDYDVKSAGEALTKLYMEEEEMRAAAVRGKSFSVDLCPGYKLNLTNHFSDNGKYTLTSVTHLANQPLDTGSGEAGFTYQNQFTCIDNATPYRPIRSTPIPSIQGVQTAVVVGPSGEEIYTDKYGRVKVQFFWDRQGTKDENSSCWVRVATYWAGKTWGAIHIPRIGQEVVVDFVEGDVDHPLIIGSVYNADEMPPYTLPDEKTKSTLKSNSSKGGGGFNEIRLEDKKGSEEVFFHAEKDLNSVIKHDETREVDNDRTTTIKHDESQTVTNNETIVVDQGNQTVTLNMGNQTITLKQGNQSTELKMGNQSTKLDMGNQDITLSMGNQTTKLNLGAVSTEAMQSITLKVGQSSITIDQMGVTIQGMMIKIQGQIQVQVTGLMTQVNGDAMTMVKGGIVMIN